VTRRGDLPRRRAAALVGVTGAVGSVALTIVAGHSNPSVLLIAMFVVWVLTPFAALAAAFRASSAGSGRLPSTLLLLTLVTTAASLGIYGSVAFGVLRVKTGFAFLVLPPTLVLVVLVAVIATRRGRP
jgi:hypothetical protein